jgi:hypothetical protein
MPTASPFPALRQLLRALRQLLRALRYPLFALRYLVLAAALSTAMSADAQAPAPPAPPDSTPVPADATKRASTPVDITTLKSLAWLDGCWRGAVNQREFREHWMPLRGAMMLGMGQTVMQDKTQDYDYLRLESRADGVHYVIIPSGQPETDLRLTAAIADDAGSEFTFVNRVDAFPQRVVYRRMPDGWLYATIEGKLNGEERKQTFPFRRVGCETGEPIRK